MKSAGASPEALEFTESLAASLGVVYLRAFRRVERVDIAYIEYGGFRANELEGVLLVNGGILRPLMWMTKALRLMRR